MSDVMLFGVLRMPYEIAMSNELSRMQFWGRAQDAVDRIEELEASKSQLDELQISAEEWSSPPLRAWLGEKDSPKAARAQPEHVNAAVEMVERVALSDVEILGIFRVIERRTRNSFTPRDVVLEFTAAILSAQADMSTQSTDAENVSKNAGEIDTPPLTQYLIAEATRDDVAVDARDEVFQWLMGCGDDFPMRPDGAGLYWWRKELRNKLATLAACKEKD